MLPRLAPPGQSGSNCRRIRAAVTSPHAKPRISGYRVIPGDVGADGHRRRRRHSRCGTRARSRARDPADHDGPSRNSGCNDTGGHADEAHRTAARFSDRLARCIPGSVASVHRDRPGLVLGLLRCNLAAGCLHGFQCADPLRRSRMRAAGQSELCHIGRHGRHPAFRHRRSASAGRGFRPLVRRHPRCDIRRHFAGVSRRSGSAHRLSRSPGPRGSRRRRPAPVRRVTETTAVVGGAAECADRIRHHESRHDCDARVDARRRRSLAAGHRFRYPEPRAGDVLAGVDQRLARRETGHPHHDFRGTDLRSSVRHHRDFRKGRRALLECTRAPRHRLELPLRGRIHATDANVPSERAIPRTGTQ